MTEECEVRSQLNVTDDCERLGSWLNDDCEKIGSGLIVTDGCESVG